MPGFSYTAVISYSNIGLIDEDTLGLYWWDAGLDAWSQDGISSTVDTLDNVLTARVGHFSLFAVLGETRRLYLPLILRNY